MAYRFAVDVGALRTMIALVAPGTDEIIAYERPYTHELFPDGKEAGLTIADAIKRFIGQHRVKLDEISGVAVGVPGVVDRAKGYVYACPNLHVLDDSQLGPNAQSVLGLPVYVDNNTNLIALGEFTAGAGHGTRDMAVIFVGSGVGCGLILDGRLYEGADGAAPEFGHINIVPDGRLCTCGAHGCLEMYCSGKAFSFDASELWEPDESANTGTRFGGAQRLVEQAHVGHTAAQAYLDEAFYYMGLGVTALVNMLNPRLVVLGDDIMLACPEGLDIVRQTVFREALPGIRRDLSIEMSELQHDAGVLGGAALVAAGGDITRVGLEKPA